MFATEQPIASNVKNQTKNQLLSTGTRLAKRHSVKKRFTYRELTLLVGIIVAAIVLFTFLSRQSSALSDLTSDFLPKFISPIKTGLIKEVILDILFTN